MGFRLAAYAAFVLSGAAGLIYEVLWSRYLGLLVGHSAYAQVIVLAVFLGGMGAGALLAGRWSARLVDPLKWYARVEILIGLLGFAFDPVFRWLMGAVFERLLPAAGTGPASLAATWLVACLAILPQAVLLGTTFPLMTAGVMRRAPALPGRLLAMLYGSNSAGAAVGAIVAGFVLVPALGLPGAILTAGTLNLAAGLIALVLSAREPSGAALAAGPEPAQRAAVRPSTVMLIVAAGTAVASFLYEVSWIRMLSLLLGSATHAFETMLSAFILGLALGAFWVRRGTDGWAHPLRALGIIQFVMGVTALATLPLYHDAFGWLVSLMRAFDSTPAGYAGFSMGRYAISLAIMLPSTFCAGATLPLITKVLLAQGVGEGAIGRVYGVNTLGSIAGVILAGLFLLPLIGLKATLITGAALDIALGIVVLAAAADRTTRRLGAWAVAAGAALVVATAAGPGLDEQLIMSGAFRTGFIPARDTFEPLFHRDGRTATITVYRNFVTRGIVISSNGKPDASLPEAWLTPCTEDSTPLTLAGDPATQTLAPLVALAHKPDARNAAVIGFGSGMSSSAVLAGAPDLQSLVTIEIEPAMVEGARLFLPANHRAYDDPRSTIVIEDARAYFARTGLRFDYILSEPSNPWVAGVSGLFTTEFYRQIRRQLSDDGVFAQWFQLYELNDVLAQSILAAIHENFGSYAVYQTDYTNALVVATPAAELRPAAWSAVFDQAALREDLCHVVPIQGAMLEASRLLDRRALAPLLDEGGGANSDYYPVLDLGAERARYLRQRAAGIAELAEARFDFVGALTRRPMGFGTDTVAVVPDVPRQRAQAVAAALRVPAAPVGASRSDAFTQARYLVGRWYAQLERSREPADWRAWLAEFEAVERVVHGAARGIVDTIFYDRVGAFLARAGAPDRVRDAVEFRRGLAAWDFPLVQASGARLVAAAAGPEVLVAPRELLEGVVTANLLTGNAVAADSLFRRLLPQVQFVTGDLRLLLLAAYVHAAGSDRRPLSTRGLHKPTISVVPPSARMQGGRLTAPPGTTGPG
jgi:spermidine synthase